jgi:hypothetical protein
VRIATIPTMQMHPTTGTCVNSEWSARATRGCTMIPDGGDVGDAAHTKSHRVRGVTQSARRAQRGTLRGPVALSACCWYQARQAARSHLLQARQAAHPPLLQARVHLLPHRRVHRLLHYLPPLLHLPPLLPHRLLHLPHRRVHRLLHLPTTTTSSKESMGGGTRATTTQIRAR